MPPSVKTMMPTSIDPSAPAPGAAVAGPSNSKINLREFVADDDAANFGSALWKTIDQSAFVLAQREALEAFNFAKAIRLSEETAVEEAKRRQAEVAAGAPPPIVSQASSAAAAITNADTPASGPRETQASSSSSSGGSPPAHAQPMMIRKHSRRPSSSNDVAASIPRSLAMDGVQPVLLENKPSSSPPSSSSFSPVFHPIKTSASSSPPSYSKLSSASAVSSSSSSRISKQPSQNLSLSTSSSSSPPSSSSASSSSPVPAIQVQAVDSHYHISSSSPNSSLLHPQSHSHSRASSHSNAIPALSATSSNFPSHRIDHIEQRSLSKRELSPPSSSSSLSVLQSQLHSSSSTRPSASRTQSSPSSPSQLDMTTTTGTSTKRRRTSERQPSSVSSSTPPTSSSFHNHHTNTNTNSHNTMATTTKLVAPPISEAKKSSSSASARDVLLGQLMNPASATAKELNTNATPGSTLAPQSQEQSQPRLHRRRSTHPAAERGLNLDLDLDLFTATRNCVRCGNLVVSPRNQPSLAHDPFSHPFSDLLHLICTACGTTHCRGCFSVVRCPYQCNGGQNTCAVRSCCPGVKAIAIFEALSSFDWVVDAEAGYGFAGKGKGSEGKQHLHEQRREYLRQVIGHSKASAAVAGDKDKSRSVRRFEDAFVRTLRILCSWLQPLSSSHSDDAMDEKGVKHPSPSPLTHPTIALLFANSYLPEVMHLFLSNTNVRDWVAHSETYLCLLTLLRRMFDLMPVLEPVLVQPLRWVRSESGLAGVVWGKGPGAITWEAEMDEKNGALLGSRSLWEVVKSLEVNTRPGLRALAGRLQFAGTVEKVESLCDGISYLLLQQVVGGI